VLAGSQPLIGASVELYAASTSGNGASASSLLSSLPTTGTNGAFTVAAGYTCPSATSLIYVVARGGKPAAASSANSAISLITVIGVCDQVSASTAIVVNEATTVATVYALSQFLSAGGNIGSSATNTVGLANAVATAGALADITAGSSPGPSFASNGTSPAPRIDSIANLLNACVVSSSVSNACIALFSATTPANSSAPTNTLDAVLNLSRRPTANVATLYAMSTASSAFAPALAAAPADWTLFVNYTGGGMSEPSGLGIDGNGNVWVANYFDVASYFSPLGKPILAQGITGDGLSASYGLAVDGNNNAWIPNQPNYGPSGGFVSGNSVSVLNSTGQSVAGSGGFTGGGIDYPTGVAIDTDNSVWVVDYGSYGVTHLSNSGTALSGPSGYQSSQLIFPVAAAIDGSHNVWVVNQSGDTVTKITPDGSQFTTYPCGGAPSGIAVDQLGNVWIANYYGSNISEISNSGANLSNGFYFGGGIDAPQAIAIDGAGNAWIANYHGTSVTELAGAASSNPGTVLSGANGLGQDAGLVESYAIAVDAGGNVWVTGLGSNMLTEFIGLAPPVKAPRLGPPVAP